MKHGAEKTEQSDKKRKRSVRACLVCRQRKVKCDAVETYPERCSNCVLFHIAECRMSEPKRRKSRKLNEFLAEHDLGDESDSTPESPSTDSAANPGSSEGSSEVPAEVPAGLKGVVQENLEDAVPEVNGIELDQVSVTRRLVQSEFPEYLVTNGPSQMVQNVMKKFMEVRPRQGPQMDTVEFQHLVSLGCFRLPSEALCRRYIDAYFRAAHWQQPVLCKDQFLADYRDLQSPPSLLLLQAVLFAGSRAYEEPGWGKRQRQHQETISCVLHRRARALYRAKMEQSPMAILQALIIFGNYSDADFVSAKNGFFYYIKLAICMAYGMDVRKSRKNCSDLAEQDRRTFKRLWWTLYTKDCFYSFTLGRPFSIAVDGGGAEPLEEADLDTDAEHPAGSAASLHILHRCRLAVATRKVAEYIEKARDDRRPEASLRRLLEKCDTLLSQWIRALPKCLQFDANSEHSNLFAACLAMEYYSVLLVLHRANIVRRLRKHTHTDPAGDSPDTNYYPSWSITFKAAHIISIVGQYLLKHRYLPLYHSFLVYGMLTAGIMMIYHLYNKDKAVSAVADHDFRVCADVLKASTIQWPIAHFGWFFLDTIYHDRYRQYMIIKDVVKLDFGTNAKDVAAHVSQIVSSSRVAAPPLSSSNSNTSSTTSNSIAEPADSSTKVTDASAKTIMYTRPSPSSQDILRPNGTYALRDLAEAPTEPPQSCAFPSAFSAFPDRMGNIFPEAVKQDWVPSFDAPELPDFPAQEPSTDMVNELFEGLGNFDMGLWGQ